MFRSLRVSHVEFRFPGSEKLGPSRNGRMERNFPVIPIFRNFRPASRGTHKISERNSGNCLFHSLHNPEFPDVLVEWEAPLGDFFRCAPSAENLLRIFKTDSLQSSSNTCKNYLLKVYSQHGNFLNAI